MLILGSGSPRRKYILELFSLPFKQVSSDFDESKISFNGNPEEYVKKTAKEKALSLKRLYFNEPILTADTIVCLKHKIFTKPATEKEAFAMLRELSGSWHTVYTGVCVCKEDKLYCEAEATKVLFYPLTEKQIERYLSHFYYQDKAGGYAIQDGGCIVVKSIEGCFYNIMGLPINTTKELLLKVGIDLWDYLK